MHGYVKTFLKGLYAKFQSDLLSIPTIAKSVLQNIVYVPRYWQNIILNVFMRFHKFLNTFSIFLERDFSIKIPINRDKIYYIKNGVPYGGPVVLLDSLLYTGSSGELQTILHSSSTVFVII